MPIYEHQCANCNKISDILQKLSDEPVKICPNCGAEGLQRLVSAAAFQLKGTGWYETDFKNKDKPPASPKKEESTASATTTTKESPPKQGETS